MTFLARGIVRYRVLIIALWAVIGVLAVPRATRVNEVLQVEAQVGTSTEAATVRAKIKTAFDAPLSKVFGVAIKGPVPVDSADFQALLTRLTRAAQAESYISQVHTYQSLNEQGLLSEDRHTTILVANIRLASVDTATRITPRFRETIHRAADLTPGSRQFEIYVTGEPALDYDTRTISAEDAKTAEFRALIPTAFILLLAFGAVVAAALPIMVGVFSISCALAAVHVAAAFHPMSVFVLMIVTMIGLGVGIDYSLLIVTRFREEMNRGNNPREAGVRTILTAGRAVLTSGLTVLVGFATLLITPIIETRSVGIGGVFVVTVAVLLSTTLLPAVLTILGRSIDWPKWLAKRLAWYHSPRAWERWARWLSHHPWRAVVLGLSLVALITWPLAKIEIGLPTSGWFPDGAESTLGVELLEEVDARNALQPIRIVLEAPEGERVVSSRFISGLRRFSDSIYADERVERVRGPVDIAPGISRFAYLALYGNLDNARERHPEFFEAYVSSDARIALMDVVLNDSTNLNSGLDVVRRIREVANGGVRGLDSISILVGGFSASSLDLQDDLLAVFPMVVILVLAITGVMLLIAFQSLLVPIKAVIMNCLSVAGAFGLVVLVFQEGVGGGLFGLSGPTEAVYSVVPVLVFAVVFGLSMDYEVFLLARIKEAFNRTRKNDLATMEGLSVTASVITSAAAIMIVVFGSFAFSRVFAAKLMAFGLAVAVFLDATLIRMVLVPAFMHIAGRWNWWPGVRRVKADAEVAPARAAALEEHPSRH